MAVLEDVLDIKNAVVENWDDILETAQQLEKLIMDGLDSLDNPSHLKRIMPLFLKMVSRKLSTEQLTDLVNESDNIAFRSVDPLFKSFQQPYSIPDIPTLPKELVETFRNIFREMAANNFDISINDIWTPPSKLTTASISQSQKSGDGDSRGLLDGLTNAISQKVTSLRSQFEDTFDGFISQLISNADWDSIIAAQQQIEAILGELDSDNSQSDNSRHQFSNLLKIDFDPFNDLLVSFVDELVTLPEKLSSSLYDIATTQIIEGSELHQLYSYVTRDETPPTVAHIFAIFVATPITVFNKAIDNQNFDIPEHLFQCQKGFNIGAATLAFVTGLSKMFITLLVNDTVLKNLEEAKIWAVNGKGDHKDRIDGLMNIHNKMFYIVSGLGVLSDVAEKGLLYPDEIETSAQVSSDYAEGTYAVRVIDAVSSLLLLGSSFYINSKSWDWCKAKAGSDESNEASQTLKSIVKAEFFSKCCSAFRLATGGSMLGTGLGMKDGYMKASFGCEGAAVVSEALYPTYELIALIKKGWGKSESRKKRRKNSDLETAIILGMVKEFEEDIPEKVPEDLNFETNNYKKGLEFLGELLGIASGVILALKADKS